MSTDGSRRDEAGSTLVTAVIVMVVLSTLSLAALTRTLASLQFVRQGQDFDAALALADAGLADAQYEIDLAATPRTAPASFERSGQIGLGSYRYTAIKRSDAAYDVYAVGQVGRSRHGIRARLTRDPKFPFALFSNRDLVFDGNSNANIYAFDGSGKRAGESYVGSNHQIVVGSGKGAGDQQHYFAPYGGCSGCPMPVPHLEASEDVKPVTDPSGATQECPGAGTFSGAIDGGGGIPFACRRDVTFTGTVTVTNGPLIVYVLPLAGSNPPVHHALDISGAVVNPAGSSIEVQVFKAGSAPLVIGTGNTSNTMTFNGIMYAPESTVTVNGGKFWRGSWVIDALNVNGGPNIEIAYDLDTRAYYGRNWRVSRYEEIPSAMVDEQLTPAASVAP